MYMYWQSVAVSEMYQRLSLLLFLLFLLLLLLLLGLQIRVCNWKSFSYTETYGVRTQKNGFVSTQNIR